LAEPTPASLAVLADAFARHPAAKPLFDGLSPGEPAHFHLTKTAGAQQQLLLAAVASAHSRNLLVIVQDRETALYVHNDLEALHPKRQTLLFPGTGKRPHQPERVDNANVLQRAEVLNALNASLPGSLNLITYPEALYEKVVDRKALTESTLRIQQGEKLDQEFVMEVLESYGFERADFVYEPGQYAIRGGILDVYSFADDYPYRIEFLGDEVESIRAFDPAEQLSLQAVNAVALIPNIQTHFDQDEHVSLLAYLSPETLLAIENVDLVAHELDRFGERVIRDYEEQAGKDGERTVRTSPAAYLYSRATFLGDVERFAAIELGPIPSLPRAISVEVPGDEQPRFNKDFKKLADHFKALQDQQARVTLVAENDKQARRLHEIFEHTEPPIEHDTVIGSLSGGFYDPELKWAVYTDHQVFERYHRYRTKQVAQRAKAITLKELTELKPGDYITHVNHGIGQFAGLVRLEHGDTNTEAVKLIFRDGDQVFVNINALYKIAKFTGRDGTQPTLSKLGTGEWERKKDKVKKRVKQLAFDLVELYAKRKSTTGHAFGTDHYLQQELEASFLYEDTPDQEAATEATKQDMEQTYPMDRLVCGDVGFGKTEIAVRAAFKAIIDGKQVALLVPTTILAMQHYQTFQERYERFGVKVEYVNRFRSTKEIKDVLKRTLAGEVDMLIGTHRLLGKDVQFKNLGLLIIDEEHKFGVAAKEKLRLKKVNVDTLTLTATPIPRTLQFSLLGIRDMSIITTPPPNRQPVETALHPFESELIRDAIAYELKRGGQVFFVHNRIKDLEDHAGLIKRLLPDVRLAVAHGQMDGQDVERIMLGFIERQYDVLVCTTIVESGLDIPNANTIIINQAQQYGLSDLHQMRGRVGRSNRKAFCYLLAPPLHTLPTDSRKRLTALLEFSDLGSGIQIAMRDLDIRGAGDILGAEQSGYINDVGFEVYAKILSEAIEELKVEHFGEVFGEDAEETEAFRGGQANDTQVDTEQPAFIPETYVGPVAERLSLYRRISEAEDEQALRDLGRELVDRFGLMPAETLALFDTIRLRELAKSLGFERVVHKQHRARCYFPANNHNPYFQSATFRELLSYLKAQPEGLELKQATAGKLTMVVADVPQVKDVLLKLQAIHGYIYTGEAVTESA